MHKNLHVTFPVLLFLVLPASLPAQVNQGPVSRNEPVYQVAPLPVNVNPEDMLKHAVDGEKQQQVNFIAADSTKRFSAKKEASGVLQKQHCQQTWTDKYGSPDNTVSPAERSQNNQTNTAEKLVPDTGFPINQEGIFYLDLQVTATPESPQIQVLQGSERLPKTVAQKTETLTPAEKISAPDTSHPSTIGKVSFLKQYATELKQQIEKNKDNANYPLAEKQQELLQLENLLKGE